MIYDTYRVAWLLTAPWVPTVLTRSGRLTDLVTWSHDRPRRLICEVIGCDRNGAVPDPLRKLIGASLREHGGVGLPVHSPWGAAVRRPLPKL